ncbi:glycoside hydrolase family 26 protein [Lacisediminihabitans sp. H27-G8]|uniref:glycoside hydrolase family 26 protein n=1 Tax=Lacisediminihabitans sp. H27-G8 TaxID=3111909 RepID=UPI0038FCCCD1
MSFLKRSNLSRPGTWWALSSTRARFTAAGAAVLVLGLVATSVIVWNSPANPVTQAAASVTRADIATAKIVAERNSLLSQVIALQKQLSGSKGNLSATKAQLASIQQQLYSAQGALDAAAAAKTTMAARAKPITRKPSSTNAAGAVVTAPSKAEIINPTSRYFGMYTEQAPFNFASFDATAKKIGSQPNAVGYFGGWDQTFRADVVKASWKRNTLPILTWESRPIGAANDAVEEPDYSLPKIIGDPATGVPGNFDAYLHQYAKDIVASGLPLGIRLDHEMNGVWYPWSEDDAKGTAINGNRPGDYVKMWQHVHDIFQEEGANSLVAWIWAPNVINNLPATHKAPAYLDSLYPGSAYVDVVGLSGYLRPAYKPDNNFTFDYTFTPSLKELRRITDKPILLAEIGASEVGGHKAAWISSLFQALAKPENQDIIGFSWFNLAVTSYTEGELATNDWRIDSRPDSLAAFTAGLALPGGRFDLSPQ